MSTPFDALLAYQRQSEALGRIAQRLGWDHETVMPPASGDDRSEEMAALEGVMHVRGSGAELGDLLSAVDPDQLTGTKRRMFELPQNHTAPGPRLRPRMMFQFFCLC